MKEQSTLSAVDEQPGNQRINILQTAFFGAVVDRGVLLFTLAVHRCIYGSGIDSSKLQAISVNC